MSDSTVPYVDQHLDQRIAEHLRRLRAHNGWSLDDLAARSGVSRATLGRIEKAEVSATAVTLGRLAHAYGLSISRLMSLAELGAPAVLTPQDQPVWQDPATGFRRRSISPPADGLAGEVIECALPPATRIAYPGPAKPGHEHHLLMLDGALTVCVEGGRHLLAAGDCLRFRLHGASVFETGSGASARYLIFLL